MSCALQSRPRARLDSHACSDGRSESICICTQTTESVHRKPTPASPRHTAHPRLRSAHSSLYVNYFAHSHTEVHSQPKCHGESTRTQQNSQSSCESAPWATLLAHFARPLMCAQKCRDVTTKMMHGRWRYGAPNSVWHRGPPPFSCTIVAAHHSQNSQSSRESTPWATPQPGVWAEPQLGSVWGSAPDSPPAYAAPTSALPERRFFSPASFEISRGFASVRP